jgi:hypothetical protein
MSEDMDDALADRIFRARLFGLSTRLIADQFNVSIADVNEAVDRRMSRSTTPIECA